ncbi:hypothetical protein RhiirA5_2234 [Rhizophagus irregularis]|uniref:Uncharacterized protein n=1 Tax=Rhizophagus irregularis TaxID=588596 RepID=A0A2N0PCB1_9GLOM|nr:hypothetical protein RhiirA5_2234 [Rhizophagus irregularis]
MMRFRNFYPENFQIIYLIYNISYIYFYFILLPIFHFFSKKNPPVFNFYLPSFKSLQFTPILYIPDLI